MRTESATQTSRRNFVRTFTLGSATTVVGRPWIETLLAALLAETNTSAASNGVLTMQLSDFPALQNALGSVRVSVDPLAGSSPSGAFYPVIVTCGNSNDFYAVSSNCTHRGCVVSAYDGNVISCPCHGSQFAMDGSLVKGPATTSLATYQVLFDGTNTLKVTVPGLGYSITRCTVINGASPRVRLDFPTFAEVDYEVQFRSGVTGSWSVVPFSTTPTGALTTKFITGNGQPASLYVGRTTPTGFYSISIVLREV
jgi:Rieske Fe-S protein